MRGSAATGRSLNGSSTASPWPGSATVVQLVLCSLAAFAFARIPFRGKRPLYLLVLLGIMVPFEAVLIPVYLLFAGAHLHNTWWALIAPDIASPLALFLLTQFFQEIPTELDEAAYLDGASRFTVYWRIILPLATPILATLAIFTFLGTSNEYLWPLVSATDRNSLTITIGLRKLAETFGHQERDLGLKMAGASVGGIPILIFYFIFQRRIVAGNSAHERLQVSSTRQEGIVNGNRNRRTSWASVEREKGGFNGNISDLARRSVGALGLVCSDGIAANGPGRGAPAVAFLQ